MSEWLTLAQAAQTTGLTPDTIRRRVKRGELVGKKVVTAYGPAWRVCLNGHGEGVVKPAEDPVAGSTPSPDPSPQGVAEPAGEGVGLVEALRLVEKLTQQNLELSGRVGYFQAQLEQARETILALEAPKAADVERDTAPGAEAAPEPATRPWWRFW